MIQVVESKTDLYSKLRPMANRNIAQDSLLPHPGTREPSRSPLAVIQVRVMDNPHQAPRSTMTTSSTDIGRLPSINPLLDPRPTLVSARSEIVLLHQLIDIHYIPSIRISPMINPNLQCRIPTQLKIMKMKQRSMSKITLNKDGLCSGIGFYQVKAREDPKQLQDIIPSLHYPLPLLDQFRLLPNY